MKYFSWFLVTSAFVMAIGFIWFEALVGFGFANKDAGFVALFLTPVLTLIAGIIVAPIPSGLNDQEGWG